MSIYTLQATFARGEISPRLHSRADIEHWSMALKTCVNYFVMRQGGLQKRTGTIFASEVKDSSKQTRLIPFVFSIEQAYVVEMGDLYARYYANGGQVLDMGVPVETALPYLEAELFDVQYAQSADTAYLVHGSHPQATLTRTDAVTFTHSPINFTSPPGEWAVGNYPTNVAFYNERLCFAATPNEPQTLWLSKAGILTDHGISAPLVADDAIEITILAGEVNAIQWMAEGQDLLIGTNGASRTLGPSDRGSVFSATNLVQRRHSRRGSTNIQPVQVGNVVLYVSRFGDRLYEYLYSFEADGYVAPELTVLSEHILRRGVVDMAYAQDPESIVWMVLGDGEIAALTYDREQQIVGLTRHKLGGDGIAESVAVIPGEEADEVWFVVRRTINGQTRRYIEYLAPPHHPGDPIEDSHFIDCGSIYDGPATGTVSGLDHLEGESVTILADGAVVPAQMVSGGAITLPDGRMASKIQVGLGYEAEGQTLPVAVSRGDGSGLGRPKRIAACLVDLLDSSPLKVKGPGGDFVPTHRRSASDPMGAPPPLRTGFSKIAVDSSWQEFGEIAFKSDAPLPSIIRSITLNLETSP